MNEQELAESAAAAMYADDQHVHAMGMVVDSVGPGRACVSMVVKPEMVNGHSICHGGVIFSLADTALAYASNSYGGVVVAHGASIEFVAAARVGDRLEARASETIVSGRNSYYDITVWDGDDVVALFKGRCRRLAHHDDGTDAP